MKLPLTPGNSEANDQSLQQTNAERSPAFSILLFFVLGILLDSWIQWQFAIWILISLLLAFAWSVGYSKAQFRFSAVILLLLTLSLGGMRHHSFWFNRSPVHISCVLSETGDSQPTERLIRVSGVVTRRPVIKIPADSEQFNPDQPIQKSNFILECQHLHTNAEAFPVTGKLYVTVFDSLDSAEINQAATLAVGDVVDLTGKLSEFSTQDNPEDYDFRTHFRKQQIDVVLSLKSSQAIQILTQAPFSSLDHLRSQIQSTLTSTIRENTSATTQPIGLALLLGNRSELSFQTQQEFSQSGLIHFLAISGLHIGFFSAFVWGLCHVLNLPRTLAAGLLLGAIVFYLLIIEVRPPIIRAASFCALVTLGLISWRAITTLNLVCISAILILVINPTDLFDVGTQLSFLAVASILWTVKQDFFRNPFEQSWMPLRWQILSRNPALQSSLQWCLIRYGRAIYSVFLVTFFIWLATAPLVLYHFKLLAPIGLLVNTLIFPFLFLVLLLGYLLIFLGSWIPFLAGILGVCFDFSLQILLQIVKYASSIPGAWYDLPAPPFWWIAGYYILLLIAVWPLPGQMAMTIFKALRRLRVALVPGWILTGLLLAALLPAGPSPFRCTFIAVDHGVAILIQSPEGKTVLYDAGSLAPVEQTYAKIKNTLLAAGVRRVDLLLLSHADRDHYNAAAPLISNQFIREVAFPQAFLRIKQSGTMAVCDMAAKNEIPITIVSRGDQIRLGPSTTLQVLHPELLNTYTEDNPASLTVLLTHKTRKILLTGDLDGDGLETLLTQSDAGPIDILLSPHHGSFTANTRDLDRWARPQYLIVSGGRKQTIPYLKQVYSAATEILTTRTHGAINCQIDDAGHLEVVPFRVGRNGH